MFSCHIITEYREMITKRESIPQRTKRGMAGQDVFYAQFNDVRFYVEDTEQEQFYYEILRKLFPNMRLTKIFPLGGKEEVISKARICTSDRCRVFLVDKDFDDILRKKVSLPNLFYLKQYSIENYLLEHEAVHSVIVEEQPRLKISEIRGRFLVENFINERVQELVDLFTLFLVAQVILYKNCSFPPERFVEAGNKYKIDQGKVDVYRKELIRQFLIKQKFDDMVGTFTKKAFRSKNPSMKRRHISGKYLCYLTKNKLCSEFHLKSLTNESFCYRLAKNGKFSSLGYLQKAILRFMQN